MKIFLCVYNDFDNGSNNFVASTYSTTVTTYGDFATVSFDNLLVAFDIVPVYLWQYIQSDWKNVVASFTSFFINNILCDVADVTA